MLALMYETVPPGRLKCTTEELARLVGAKPEELEPLLAELKHRGILHTRGGVFFSPFLDRLLTSRRGARARQQRHRDHAETPQGECHASGHGTVTGQSTDADSDADRDRESLSTVPTLAEVEAEAAKIGLGVKEGRRFYEHYQGTKWKDKGGKPIRKWKGALRTWTPQSKPGEQPAIEPRENTASTLGETVSASEAGEVFMARLGERMQKARAEGRQT